MKNYKGNLAFQGKIIDLNSGKKLDEACLNIGESIAYWKRLFKKKYE